MGKGRAKGSPKEEKPKPSDAHVPVITSAKLKDGWSLGKIIVSSRYEDVVTDPDGVGYVRAGDNERADLIVDHTQSRVGQGLGRSRWRKLEASSKGRKAAKQKQDAADGAVAHKAKRAKRKAKRLARKKKVA